MAAVTGSRSPSNRSGFATRRSAPPRPGRRPSSTSAAPSGEANTSSIVRIGEHGHATPPRARSSHAPPAASRTLARASGPARPGSRRGRGSSRTARRRPTPACPTTSHVRRNSRSFPAARMNGSIRGVEGLVRHDVRVRGAQGRWHHASDQRVRRLVHHRGHARVEERRRSRGGRRPVRSRSASAARMPIAACRPVTTSSSATPAFTGSPSRLARSRSSGRRAPAR